MEILSYDKSYFMNTFKSLIQLQNWYIMYIFTSLFSPIFTSIFLPTWVHGSISLSDKIFLCQTYTRTLFSLYDPT